MAASDKLQKTNCTKRNIECIVQVGLCTQCGWCIPNCPAHAITQRETPGGHLFPSVDAEKCTLCGLCVSICAGWHLEEELLDSTCGPFEGPIIGVFCGYAVDSNIRANAQSGGIVSAILSHQLDSEKIEGAIVSIMPKDGTLRPYAIVARTPDEVLRASGSKYCPIRFKEGFRSDFSCLKSFAVVGTPCQIHTIRNFQTIQKSKLDKAGLAIGLFCDRLLSFCVIDRLCQMSGFLLPDVVDFKYRGKERDGWPGEVVIEDQKGEKRYLPAQERIDIKDPFTASRCRICFDKTNFLSDISVGDPYRLRVDKQGYSVIIARTVKGLNALKAAEKEGYIILEPVDSEKLFEGQKIPTKKKEWLSYISAWMHLGRIVPEYHFSPTLLGFQCDSKDIKKKMNILLRSERVSKQPTRELALKEARRQLFWHRISNLFSVRRVRRFLGEWNHNIKAIIFK